MARCEDFPCCGHAFNECPTGPAKECPDCGRMFEPTSMNNIYCLACGSRPRLPKFDMGPMLSIHPNAPECAVDHVEGNCVECEAKDVPLYWARYGKEHENLCHECADAYCQAAADDAQDERYGDYD